MKYYLGIEIDTTTISGLLMDETEKVVDCITLSNNSKITGECFGLQDVSVILGICQDIYDKISRENAVFAMGFTGQMHGVVYVDEFNEAVSPLYTWQNDLGDLPYIDGITYAEYLSRKSGCEIATGFGITTLFYHTVNGLIPKNGKKILTVQEYVASKFCKNTRNVMHASNAAGIGCFDVEYNVFYLQKLANVGIEVSYLPDVTADIEVLGRTEDGRLVFVPVGDNQASVYGSATKDTKAVILNVGTGSQVSVIGKKYKSGDFEVRPYVDGLFLYTGCALCGGAAYSALSNFYKETLAMFGFSVSDDMIYNIMESCAVNGGVCADTRFNGSRKFPRGRGAINNLTLQNFIPQNLTYAVIEGIVNELYTMYEAFAIAAEGSMNRIIASGNGIRKNKIMQKIACERFGLNLTVGNIKEEAAYGIAKLVFNKSNK